MKVVALISGGKDSCYNMMQCVASGHEIVALANLRPANTDELDSYMFQTVGHQAIDLYAEAMDLPLYRHTIQGSSLAIGRDYNQTEGDEVEDLFQLLHLVKAKEAVEAVSVGAILSDYQRVRVENVCLRLGLQPLAYLWRRDQDSLLSDMISSGLHAILIKVAAFGLDPDKHLGKQLADMQPYLRQLSEKYGVHICGEGGEYETFTLDCPLFKKKIVIDAMETVIHSADAFAPVGYLRFTQMHVENKHAGAVADPVACAGCPCQEACDNKTEEVEYADQAPDKRQEFASNCGLACQQGHGLSPTWSPRTTGGYQWITGITGQQSPEAGVQAQTTAAFSLLRAEMDSQGWQMSHIVLVHLYVRHMEDFAALNSIYKKHFGVNPPARVCVQAPLAVGQLLQMDCLLHHCGQPLEDGFITQREALHVQSLSHWAPANIGPYSQALRVGECVFCAGQIALVPCTMELLKARSGAQARMAFSHMRKVLEAVHSSLTLGHVLQAHCYVTRRQDVKGVRDIWEDLLRTAKEEDLLSEPEAQHGGRLLVAVVPALPRGATVELHATAVRDNPADRTSCQLTSKVTCASIESHAVVSGDKQNATFSLSLVQTSPCPGPGAAGNLLEAVGATLGDALKKMTGDRLVPLCARLFYTHDHPLANQVAAGLCDCLRTSLDHSSPALALVPVLDLSDSRILHLSCWLSA
ncbi:unnamed protein product [Lota lota]